MSVSPQGAEERDRPGEVVAGFLATVAIFGGAVALAYRPFRIAPFALLVALIAAGMGGRHARLATFAVAFATACWAVGMMIAVITESPVY